MKKQNSKTKMELLVLGVLAIILISGILAYFTDIVTTKNIVNMGKVDININGYEMNGGNKVEWTETQKVVPGDTLSRIAEISCNENSEDCYVRAKVSITGENSQDIVEVDDLDIDSNVWYYCTNDGYIYYKNILTKNSDPVVLFSTVTIPLELDNDVALKKAEIKVTAEAIQSRNFTPDFSNNSNNPWPGITAADIEAFVSSN